MKIKILLQKVGDFPNILPVNFLVNSYEEVVSHDKNAISEQTFNFIKLLEFSKPFEEAVLEVRKISSLPQEISLKPRFFIEDETAKVDGKAIKKVILDKFYIPDILHSSIAEIIALNAVMIPLPNLFIERPYKPSEKDSRFNIKIVINGQIKSLKQLQDFIKDNWPELNKGIEKRYTEQIKIYANDLQVYSLKVEGRTFKEIADKIDPKNLNPKKNEDSAKQAYHRIESALLSILKIPQKVT